MIDDEKLESWTDLWKNEKQAWHSDSVDEYLMKYLERCGWREEAYFNVLVPLCGKTVDIKWLLDRGCRVFGVEGVEQAVEALFHQHNLTYTIAPLQHNDSLYQCESLPLKVFKCNFFDFPKYNTEKFEMVWDRGSFGSVQPCFRNKYVEVLKQAYASNFHHLISTLTYDQAEYTGGAPYSVDLQTTKQTFGDTISTELLERIECLEYARKSISTSLTAVHRHIFLLTPHP